MTTAIEGTITARQLIESSGIVTYFQPILSARQRSVVGAEALSRGVVGVEALSRGTHAALTEQGQLIPAPRLFEMAAREGLTLELERLCRDKAVAAFAALERHRDMILFLNFNASALEQDPDAFDNLLAQLKEEGLSPRNVAIEILESAFDNTERLQTHLGALRAHGFLLGLDDIGVGYSNLERIPLIKPDILKLDRNLVIGIENDYYRQETSKSLVQLSRRIGALVVAEGVESQAQAITALELGADLLQGYFLGRPQAPRSLTCAETIIRVEGLARRFKGYMIDRINQRKLQHRRFNIILNEILCELSNSSANQFDEILERTIVRYDNVECVYVMDEAGLQITQTICNQRIPRRNGGIMFHPAPRGADHSLKEYYFVLLDVELSKYTTDPYVSLATGNLCRTISTCFRDARNNKMYILCIDVLCT